MILSVIITVIPKTISDRPPFEFSLQVAVLQSIEPNKPSAINHHVFFPTPFAFIITTIVMIISKREDNSSNKYKGISKRVLQNKPYYYFLIVGILNYFIITKNAGITSTPS